MIDRIFARAASASLVLLAMACTPDGAPVQTSVPASAESLDFASLNGRTIEIRATSSTSDTRLELAEWERVNFRIVGKTIIWGGPWRESGCILGGTESGKRLAILFTLDRPRSDVKVPCEALRSYSSTGDVQTEPSVVLYSSTVTLQGNVLELSGELREHSSALFHTTSPFTVMNNITQRIHAKIRLSEDKCEILDFAWTTDMREQYSALPPGNVAPSHSSVRTKGCSIVASTS